MALNNSRKGLVSPSLKTYHTFFYTKPWEQRKTKYMYFGKIFISHIFTLLKDWYFTDVGIMTLKMYLPNKNIHVLVLKKIIGKT